MSKKLSLAESMRQAAQTSEQTPPTAVAPAPITVKPAAKEQAAKPAAAFHAATRAGKKKVTAPLTPEDHKRLRHLALAT